MSQNKDAASSITKKAEKLRVGLVGASPAMPHGQHQLERLRQACVDNDVELVELDDDSVQRLMKNADKGIAHPAGAYVCFRENYTLSTAILDPTGNSPDSVALIRSKDRARQKLSAAGFPQPEISTDPSQIPGPWVVKPRTGSGSVGVSIHYELAAALAACENAPDSFVETFVDGTEFSVEGIISSGVPCVWGITDKQLDGVVEIGHRYPSVRLREHANEIARAVSSALQTWNLSTGIFHVEGWWVKGEGVILGEGHIRPAGDYIHLLVSSVHGRNIFHPLIADAKIRAGGGRESATLNFPNQQEGHSAAVRYIHVMPGVIKRIQGFEEARSSPGIIAGYLSAHVGQKVVPINDSGNRLGCLVAHAGPDEDPDQLLEQALEKLHIEVAVRK